MEMLSRIVSFINGILWDRNLLLFLLVGTGIFYSFRTRFVQIRLFRRAWKRVFSGFSLNGDRADKDGMSSFQALTTAIAAQVGTGNIAGCATALFSGGPGAIFWMWISAFFGMATIYGEAVLAQKTRTRDASGHISGGPVHYIHAAFRGPFGSFLGAFFSMAIMRALGFMGKMV
ncbi:MAG: alanine:cation symporter family protein, partial [Lachnospiraceae bacterium]